MKSDIEKAIRKAAKGRKRRPEVASALKSKPDFIALIKQDVETGEYLKKLHYKQGEVTNKNGKHRCIDQPDFYTLTIQHLGLILLMPYYREKEVHAGLNCLRGRGITAKQRNNSVIRRCKYFYFDRTDLQYTLSMDMRKCYANIRQSALRKALKGIGVRGELNDFICSIAFIDGRFPIGTPLSPVAHHVLLCSFDRRIKGECPVIRYADNVVCFFRTKEEANRMKWRIMNIWWYELKIRAKRQSVIIQPMSVPLDVCGYRHHRNDKPKTSHDKGYTTVRKSTVESAKLSTTRNWGSYFGLLKSADCFRLMQEIETNMNLQTLTEKIKINRSLDAKPITPKELADNDTTFTIYDYELRKDTAGKPNWIKCLIGIPEQINGEETGRMMAREFHGGYSYIIEFIRLCEESFGKEAILPMEGCKLENRCGYVFRDSTNIIEYIDDGNQQTDRALVS